MFQKAIKYIDLAHCGMAAVADWNCSFSVPLFRNASIGSIDIEPMISFVTHTILGNPFILGW